MLRMANGTSAHHGAMLHGFYGCDHARDHGNDAGGLPWWSVNKIMMVKQPRLILI